MALTVGDRLGHYDVTALIGEGGMGQVYQATDTQLGRDVALKILPDAFAADPDRLARFQREAQVLASLNHAGIAAIYGIEKSDDTQALVLELVEGPTLAERIAKGPIPLDEALPIAKQIAEALEAAHEAGVIHRDLKPANIKVRADRTVKLLDFGLAKAMLGDSASSDLSQSPTMTAAATASGVILGTAVYMSPEQARGQPLDKRTDIWSFGCVLYEMLTGHRAFPGETFSDTIANILDREPDWQALPANVPHLITRLLRRCLRKRSAERQRDVGDARLDLEDPTPAVVSAGSETGRYRPVPSRGVLVALLVLALAALTVLGFLAGTRQVPAGSSTGVTRLQRLTDRVGLEEFPAMSPDGRSVAFTASVAGARQIFVRLVAGGAPLPVTNTVGHHEHPRWTSDSSSIVYFSPPATVETQGSLWIVSALGGAPRRIADSLGGADVDESGRLAFFRLAGERIELVTTSTEGGDVEVVGRFAPGSYREYPRWSPDGAHIAFQQGDGVRFDIYVVPSSGGEPTQVTHDNRLMAGLAWLPDSSGIIYSSSRGTTVPYLPMLNLWEARLAEEDARPITSDETSYMHPDIRGDGAVLVSRLRLQSDIWKVPTEGSAAENVANALKVGRQTGHVLTPTASPGDADIAYLSDSGGHANIWALDTESGEARQITNVRDPEVNVGVPLWSPDGTSIAFLSTSGNTGLGFGIWLVNPDGGNRRQIVDRGLGPAWSPDGRWLYYTETANTVPQKIRVDGGTAVTVRSEPARNVIGSHDSTFYFTVERPLTDGTPEFEIRKATPEDGPSVLVARIPASRVAWWQILNPALSPDGEWLAQPLTDGFTTNIWAISTSTGELRQITDFADRLTFIARRVSWSSDGRFILAAIADGDADIVRLDGLLDD